MSTQRIVYPSLPIRHGPRPTTTLVVPHFQLDQWPTSQMMTRLIERVSQLDHVRRKESRMATPETAAFWIPDRYAKGPADAFIDDHEFCHVHPLPHGSIHLTLPRTIWESIVQLGWAEPHIIAKVGMLPDTTILVYGPRNEQELEVVFSLIKASYAFAKGTLDATEPFS